MENTYTPLKQYLGSQGQDFSFSNLSTLAKSKGIENYTGTDTENKQLSQQLSTPKVSSTTLSNGNKMNQVPQMVSTVNQMVQGRGQTSDGTSIKNADGSYVVDNYQEPQLQQGQTPIYGTVNGQANRVIGYNTADLATGMVRPTYFDSNSDTPAESPEEKQFNDVLDSMKASTDATTARSISSIQQKFALLRDTQKQINAAQAAQTQNALLQGGRTGQGSSAQYAPLSSIGIVTSQLNYGVQKLAELDAQEQDLINSAQAAGDSKNYQLMEKKLAHLDDVRQEKAKQTEEINKKLVEESKKAREKMIQSTRDNALADLISQGITEPKELLSLLNGNGGDFTLKEIHEGLTNIGTAVDSDAKNLTLDAKEFFRMKEAGEVPESILALPTEAEQLNAYLRNKAIAKKAPSIAKAVTSGKLVYTPKDQSEDSKILEASRGGDGYVDPTKYEALYKAWVANGGLLKDFLTRYPPKNYVNPANDWLPVFLRPATAKKTTSANTTPGGRER